MMADRRRVCVPNDAGVYGGDVAERLSNHTLSSDAEEHERERRKKSPRVL